MPLDEVTKHNLIVCPHQDVLVSDVVSRNKDTVTFMRVFNHERKLNQQYADRWLAGERWPDLYLNYDLTILDGHHRFCAAIILNLMTIRAAVRPKTVPVNTGIFFPPMKLK